MSRLRLLSLLLLLTVGIVALLQPAPSLAQNSISVLEPAAEEELAEPQGPVLQRHDPGNPLGVTTFPWKRPSIITQTIVLVIMSLLPFIVMLLTSFAKIAIVLALLRNALGTQQAPPNQVINGVAIIITMFIMFPTGVLMFDAGEKVIRTNPPVDLVSAEAAEYVFGVAEAVKQPFKEFLQRNTSTIHQTRFYSILYKTLPPDYQAELDLDDMVILVPSFVTTQLKEAFEVGVLIYIPFFVIDLVTSNILLAMGMMMLSPITISLPLKIFLLVMLDGWILLITGLIQTYR